MEREQFGSRAAVIMAMAGTAIGLGNIWRFPYMVGENGGAAFVLVYIAATLLLSLPIFLAESVIGRRSGANCRGAMEKLAPGSRWKWFGLLSVLTPTLILSYYSVIGGWSMDFLLRACRFEFVRMAPEALRDVFPSFISSPWKPLAAHTVFLAVTAVIVAAGVKSGIERFSKWCLPVLFLLIVAIAVFSLSLPGSKEGVSYLVKPDFSKLTLRSCVAALGQSFYSLSLGMGIVITYSSYVSKQEDLVLSGFGTAVSDLLFALLAGFAIMPAVFAAGIRPNAGPGLIFDTLPFIFNRMGETLPWLSSIAAILFFLTILFAALTSSVSLLEVFVAYLVEERKMRRGSAVLLAFAVVWFLGLFSALSFGTLSGVTVFGKGIFDGLDAFCSNILLTLGGLLCVLFVGWRMKEADVRDELTSGGSVRVRSFRFIWFMIRYLAPIAIAILFISNFF